MKNLRLTGGISVLGLLVFLLVGCGGGRPGLEVEVKRYDFGEIKQGDVVTTEIAVRNVGKNDLKIEAVSTSCGCTSARIQPDVIPVGGEGKLFIRYNSGAHPDRGRVQRHIYIASNDPGEVEVIITADVRTDVQ